VIDYDELHTAASAASWYLALWGLVPKFIVIPSASLPLALLAWLGYQPNLPQSAQVLFAIRAVFALTPAAFSIAAFFIAWRFPIDEKVRRAILEGSRHTAEGTRRSIHSRASCSRRRRAGGRGGDQLVPRLLLGG
jgi:Na+/melibiose symporter-like transporter